MYTHPRLSRSTTIFLLILALLFGAYARLILVMQNDFPILDGGLFYAMTNDLLANHWHLPLTTSYNRLDIPFAYPPLPFYLLAGIHSLTGFDLLTLLRWLPALLSLLTIPVFYLMARAMLESESLGALATLIFAMLPRSWEWLIMGGGITRATGTLFFHSFHPSPLPGVSRSESLRCLACWPLGWPRVAFPSGARSSRCGRWLAILALVGPNTRGNSKGILDRQHRLDHRSTLVAPFASPSQSGNAAFDFPGSQSTLALLGALASG